MRGGQGWRRPRALTRQSRALGLLSHGAVLPMFQCGCEDPRRRRMLRKWKICFFLCAYLEV